MPQPLPKREKEEENFAFRRAGEMAESPKFTAEEIQLATRVLRFYLHESPLVRRFLSFFQLDFPTFFFSNNVIFYY
jgi:hypothetical protein